MFEYIDDQAETVGDKILKTLYDILRQENIHYGYCSLLKPVDYNYTVRITNEAETVDRVINLIPSNTHTCYLLSNNGYIHFNCLNDYGHFILPTIKFPVI